MSTPLIDRFLEEAPDSLKRRFAYDCADRAVHVYAVHALRKAGLNTEADKLARLSAIRDEETAREAADAAYADAANITSAYAAYAAYAVAYAAANAAYAANDAANAANDAANAAYWAYGESHEYEYRERSLQEAWIRRHWLKEALSVDASTLAAIDAYIANGLLIED